MKRDVVWAIIAWAWFMLMFWAVGFQNFGYMEQQATFVWHGSIVRSMAMAPGGIAQTAALFLIQFFDQPWIGALLTALMLAVSVACLVDVFKALVGEAWMVAPLAFLPTTALAIMLYNVNYMYGAVVAYMFMSLLLMMTVHVKLVHVGDSLLWGVLTSTLLYGLAGPITLLYVVVLCLIEVKRRGLKGLYMLALLAWVYALAHFSIKWGFYGTMRTALLPDGYFTHRLAAPPTVWMPWVLTVIVVLIASAVGLRRTLKRSMAIILCGLSLLASVGYCVGGIIANVNRDNEQFKRLNLMLRARDWDGVIETARSGARGNLLFQNVLNMALAETGQLDQQLFDNPVYDIRSIYQQGDKTPYISMLMSDVYYSMGHIAQAQRYAFEANEMLGNYSPRMLQRLVQTNLIYGRYAVAEKYLNILGRMRHYRQWAQEHRPFLNNDTLLDQDPELGLKRRCLFPDNRFAGIYGLDDDLRQIAAINPEHTATRQYLGALYLLSKDIGRFQQTVDAFYGGEQLPRAFEEAVLMVDSEHADSIAAHYNVSEGTLQRYAQFQASPQSVPNSFWYFYRYVR